MGKTKNSELKWALSHLGGYFSARGWTLKARPASALDMVQHPAEQIRHRLWITESPAIGSTPPQGYVPLNCFLMITFVELEALIGPCLGEETGPKSFSLGLSLTAIGSPARMHPDGYYLAETGPSSDSVAVNNLLADYDSVLEPFRSMMTDVAIFEKDDFIPPLVDYWQWTLRRLAYTKLYGGADQWLRMSARVKDEARALLGEDLGDNADQPRIFTNVEALKRGLGRYGAQQACTLIDALRTH